MSDNFIHGRANQQVWPRYSAAQPQPGEAGISSQALPEATVEQNLLQRWATMDFGHTQTILPTAIADQTTRPQKRRFPGRDGNHLIHRADRDIHLAAAVQTPWKDSKFNTVSVGSHETASAEGRVQQDFAPVHSSWAAHPEWLSICSLMRCRDSLRSRPSPACGNRSNFEGTVSASVWSRGMAQDEGRDQHDHEFA